MQLDDYFSLHGKSIHLTAFYPILWLVPLGVTYLWRKKSSHSMRAGLLTSEATMLITFIEPTDHLTILNLKTNVQR